MLLKSWFEQHCIVKLQLLLVCFHTSIVHTSTVTVLQCTWCIVGVTAATHVITVRMCTDLEVPYHKVSGARVVQDAGQLVNAVLQHCFC